MRLKIFLFLDRCSFVQLLLAFFINVFLFSLLYYFYTPGVNGILHDNGSSEFSLWQGIYFSIVTVSSLGYGDMQPLGYSRLFAVVEVLIGLGLMGMLIAKLTSSRLSYHVKRIYVSDSIRQLERYLELINSSSREIKHLITIFTKNFSDTPKPQKNQLTDNRDITILERARRSFSTPVEDLSKSLHDLKRYFEYELNNGDYFSEIPLEVINAFSNSLSEYQSYFFPFLRNVSEKKRNEFLYGNMGKYFCNLNDIIIEICILLQKHIKDTKLLIKFSSIQDECQNIKKEVIIIYVPVYEYEPPNQLNTEVIDPVE